MMRHSRRIPSSRDSGAVRRRHPQGGVEVASAHLVDLVLAATGDERQLGFPEPGKPSASIHASEGLGVDASASSSPSHFRAIRGSRRRARGGRRTWPGRPLPSSAGARWARCRRTGLYSRSTWRATVTLCTSVGPSARPMIGARQQHAGEGQLVGHAERAVHLDRAQHDVLDEPGHQHLDRGDVLPHPPVVLVLVDLPRRVAARRGGTAGSAA